MLVTLDRGRSSTEGALEKPPGTAHDSVAGWFELRLPRRYERRPEC